jgi:hypothetical protein
MERLSVDFDISRPLRSYATTGMTDRCRVRGDPPSEASLPAATTTKTRWLAAYLSASANFGVSSRLFELTVALTLTTSAPALTTSKGGTQMCRRRASVSARPARVVVKDRSDEEGASGTDRWGGGRPASDENPRNERLMTAAFAPDASAARTDRAYLANVRTGEVRVVKLDRSVDQTDLDAPVAQRFAP